MKDWGEGTRGKLCKGVLGEQARVRDKRTQALLQVSRRVLCGRSALSPNNL